MKTILSDAKKAALGSKFIEDYGKEKVFNYYLFSNYCHDLSSETNADSGIIIRDIVMEEIDSKFNRDIPHYFRGFPCID